MAIRIRASLVALIAVVLAQGAFAQDKPLELTPAGNAILQSKLAAEAKAPNDRPDLNPPLTFPLAMCAFPGGLCGAVRRDGTVAVPPRYDWVGTFSDNRAAVRLGGLYGFVDEDGREIVKPQYRIVEDYTFGFVQVDVDGKSGLIDRDGKMVIAPKYGFIRAIGPDRFRVSDSRWLGGMQGGEDFSGIRSKFTPAGTSISGTLFEWEQPETGIIDSSGQWIEPLSTSRSRAFDNDVLSIRWVEKDKLWGLARSDGSWLVEPKFQQADALVDGLARVTINSKVGFIDRTGAFAIAPVFDKAWSFELGLGRTSAQRDGIFGVIDKSGSWVFQTNYQQIHLAQAFDRRQPVTIFGWHFRTAGRWGLLNLDGSVLLDADYDQPVNRCFDGRLQAYKNKEALLFQRDGRPLQPLSGRLIDVSCGSSPPYVVKIGDKFGLVDAHLAPLSPMQFDAISWGEQDVKNVNLDGKWGRIGRDGRWLLEPRFDYLSDDTDVFVASIDGKRGFMRSDGTWLIEPKFDAARRRDPETGFVTTSGTTGVLRLADQSWVVPQRAGVMCDIGNAIMSENGGKRVILSQTGETWIDIGAERIGINLDFGLLTFLRNGKWGLVDTVGQVIVEPQFDEPVYFRPGQRGVAWAKRDSKWCAIDRRGNSVPGIACTDVTMGGGRDRFTCKVEP